MVVTLFYLYYLLDKDNSYCTTFSTEILLQYRFRAKYWDKREIIKTNDLFSYGEYTLPICNSLLVTSIVEVINLTLNYWRNSEWKRTIPVNSFGLPRPNGAPVICPETVGN